MDPQNNETRYQSAFNPILIEAQKYVANQSDTYNITLSIGKEEDGNKVNLLVNKHNGIATCDISRILQPYLQHAGAEPQYIEYPSTTQTCDWIFKDNRQFIGYRYAVNGGSSYFGYALNAVNQIGESADWNNRGDRFLSSFRKTIKYPNYESVVSLFTLPTHDKGIINFDSYRIKTFKLVIPAAYSVNNIPIYNICIENDTKQILVSKDELNNELTREIEHRPVPANPFYVRWLNQLGGWDYWMFSRRQYLSRNIGNVLTYAPHFINQETVAATDLPVHMEGVEKIKVGAEALSTEEFDALSRLIYAPIIEWYNEATEKWIRLNVEAGENTCDTGSTLHQIEFTFLLPEPQLQF